MSHQWVERGREPGDDSEAFPYFSCLRKERIHIAQISAIKNGQYRVFHHSYGPGSDGPGDEDTQELIYNSKVFCSPPEALTHLRIYVEGA